MSINLKKGQKIDLTKGGGSASGSVTKIMVGLGWDEAPSEFSFFGKRSNYDIDCDASAILLDNNGNLLSHNIKDTCVCFANLSMFNGAIQHLGDNLTGAGDGDDEQIMVDLNRIPANVDRIVFVVNIYKASKRNQHFGMIKNAFIRIVDTVSGSEFCKFDLSEGYSHMTGLTAGEIYRKNGEWKFNAIGQPTGKGDTVGDMVAIYK